MVVVADDAHDSRLLYDVNGLKIKFYTHVTTQRIIEYVCVCVEGNGSRGGIGWNRTKKKYRRAKQKFEKMENSKLERKKTLNYINVHKRKTNATNKHLIMWVIGPECKKCKCLKYTYDGQLQTESNSFPTD